MRGQLAARENCTIDSPQTKTISPDCMSYFSTELSSSTSKNIQPFQEADFLGILKSNNIASIINKHIPTYRERIFTPTKTLSMFIKQALSFDLSCTNAV